MNVQIARKNANVLTKSITSARLRSLWSVAAWQLFRVGRIRSNWIIPLVALAGGFGGAWLLRDANTLTGAGPITLNTAWGAVIVTHIIINLALVIFPFFVPRFSSQDKKERTFDMLMATPVSNMDYVGGRYLALALIFLGICCLLLAGILLAGFFLYLSSPDLYDLPAVSTILAVGGLSSLAGCFLFLGLCYTVYVLIPTLYDYACLPLVGLWVAIGNFNLVPWNMAAWDPTFSTPNLVLFRDYKQIFEGSLQQVSLTTPLPQLLRKAADQEPDLWPVILPYALYSCLGIGLVVLAGWVFSYFLRVEK